MHHATTAGLSRSSQVNTGAVGVVVVVVVNGGVDDVRNRDVQVWPRIFTYVDQDDFDDENEV